MDSEPTPPRHLTDDPPASESSVQPENAHHTDPPPPVHPVSSAPPSESSTPELPADKHTHIRPHPTPISPISEQEEQQFIDEKLLMKVSSVAAVLILLTFVAVTIGWLSHYHAHHNHHDARPHYHVYDQFNRAFTVNPCAIPTATVHQLLGESFHQIVAPPLSAVHVRPGAHGSLHFTSAICTYQPKKSLYSPSSSAAFLSIALISQLSTGKYPLQQFITQDKVNYQHAGHLPGDDSTAFQPFTLHGYEGIVEIGYHLHHVHDCTILAQPGIELAVIVPPATASTSHLPSRDPAYIHRDSTHTHVSRPHTFDCKRAISIVDYLLNQAYRH